MNTLHFVNQWAKMPKPNDPAAFNSAVENRNLSTLGWGDMTHILFSELDSLLWACQRSVILSIAYTYSIETLFRKEVNNEFLGNHISQDRV